ncbi:hypothetical protein [Rhizobium sp.]
MAKFDLSVFSDDELSDIIADATQRRADMRNSGARESGIGNYGSVGQDVHDPDHGAIPAPTPLEVEAVGPAHGADDVGRRQRA